MLEEGEQTLRPREGDSGVVSGMGSTASRPAEADRRLDPLAFPVAGWERYTCIRFLGKGGMGKVFLVHDPRLRREVALKFVRGDNPDHVRRLISEARTQAQVNHERVCKVHEVDEVEGKVYIAMQYIAGQPLGAVASSLSLEQRVTLLRDAAEGIHEAHRAGIIHRDLKPSNIMVEDGEDGRLRAYVMDFGLARSAHDDGATLSGTVIGTPRYMAPEQAIGAVGGLDRRADVYSLGATLYHVVTGKPSVEGSTLVEMVHNLVTVEPRPPRALNPDVPADLEAIILKCLEKDRSARYDSARALVEDLSRYLDGEPVLARSAGAWYRLRKRAGKHRKLVAVSAAALVISTIAVGWGARARLEAARREQFARQFTERVESIEATTRYAALSPPHDTRLDRAALRSGITELADAIDHAGEVAAGPGHYALGRAYLALGDDARARQELELAWQHGFRESRTAAALATVMGRQYHAELLAAEQLPNDQRVDRRDEVEQQYRAPALAHLWTSRILGSDAASSASRVSQSPSYLEAALAFYGGRLDDALRELDAVGNAPPDAYELPQLRGDILLARALQLRDQGNLPAALADLEASRVAYNAAAVIGRSVPAVYQALAYVENATLAIQMYQQGDAPGAFERGKDAAAKALAILPEDYDALVREASMHRSMAEYRSRSGSDVSDLLHKAVDDAEQAIRIEPSRPQARQELADCYRQWGEVLQRRSQDPREKLEKAIAASDAVTGDRSARYYNGRGLIYQALADYDDQVGGDSRVHRSLSIEAYAQALQRAPAAPYALGNLAASYKLRGAHPRAQDPEGDLRRAIELSQRSQRAGSNFIPYAFEGESDELLARLARAAGRDPAPLLGDALVAYQRGLAIDHESAHLHNDVGMVALAQASDAWAQGGDAEPALARAQAAFTQATTVAHEDGHGYDNLGELFVLRGRLASARGDDPTPEIRAAVGWMQTALARMPDDAGFSAVLAAAHTVVARYALDHGRDPEPRLREAMTALDTAAMHDPNDPQIHALRGEILGLRARAQARTHQAFDFAPAERAYLRAIELAPRDPEYALGLGELYRDWDQVVPNSQGQAMRQRGLAIANERCTIRPRWAAALVLRASLRLAEAEHAAEPDARRTLASAASADFDQALAINGHLTKAWAGRAAVARQLATPR